MPEMPRWRAHAPGGLSCGCRWLCCCVLRALLLRRRRRDFLGVLAEQLVHGLGRRGLAQDLARDLARKRGAANDDAEEDQSGAMMQETESAHEFTRKKSGGSGDGEFVAWLHRTHHRRQTLGQRQC